MKSLSTYSRWFSRLTISALLTLGASLTPPLALSAPTADPAETGERFFLETRFAQLYKKLLADGDIPNVNSPIPSGNEDPALDKAINWKLEDTNIEPEDNEFTSMNCRSCHFVDEYVDITSYGMRTYTDFARRSPVPAREDGKKTSVRNSPPLVNASLPRKIGLLLHFDAEFKTMQDLVEATLTGRNYGYLPGEKADAITHIASVLRGADGTGDLALEFGGVPYLDLLTGTGAADPDHVLPPEFLIPDNPTDQELFEGAAKLIAAYTEDLAFEQISPYDVFLEINNLPTEPTRRQSDIQYSRHLLKKIKKLERKGQLQFVTDGNFQFHDQNFRFEEEELEGLKIFFAERKRHRNNPLRGKFFGKLFYGKTLGKAYNVNYQQGGVGNCIACHAAPNFTDFKVHNVGITQDEYDNTHYAGAFQHVFIPGLYQRNQNHNSYLPATEQHPNAEEPYRAIPDSTNDQLTDLGVWNIFANPDFPKPQRRIWRILCREQFQQLLRIWHSRPSCRPKHLLPTAIARFKTPGLRDLGHSAPYFHNGQFDTLDEVIQEYIENSDLARQHKLRNGDFRLKGIQLQESDTAALVAFLQSLNEDYE